MKILALDLSKLESVGCVYEAERGEHSYRRVNTKPAELHDLLVEIEPDRVVIEVSSISGWVSDVVRALLRRSRQVCKPYLSCSAP